MLPNSWQQLHLPMLINVDFAPHLLIRDNTPAPHEPVSAYWDRSIDSQSTCPPTGSYSSGDVHYNREWPSRWMERIFLHNEKSGGGGETHRRRILRRGRVGRFVFRGSFGRICGRRSSYRRRRRLDLSRSLGSRVSHRCRCECRG